MSMYAGVFNIHARYWRAYGGVHALVRSFYLHAAVALSLICSNLWLTTGWWDMGIAVIPKVLAYTVLGFAAFLGFAKSKFLQSLAEPEADPTRPSVYAALCATFVHFIIVQVTALLFAILAKALHFPWHAAPDTFRLVLPWFNGAAGFVGFTVFMYALTSTLATVMHLFRIALMYEQFEKHSRKAN